MEAWLRALVLMVLCAAVAGCGGKATAPGAARPEPGAELIAALPPVPTGQADTRRGAMVDNDTQDGDQAIELGNATAIAGRLVMDGGSTGGDASYGVYQFTARAEQPAAVTAEAVYYDTAPSEAGRYEGYWVGYADYNRDCWVFDGPFAGSQGRVPIPPAAQLESPGGFIYCAVIACDGNHAHVLTVSVGYDIGKDYEECWLGLPRGEAVAGWADIKLDGSGAPQIAYLHGPIQGIFDDTEFRIRMARREASGWTIAPVPTLYTVVQVQLALGDGERRALLAQTANPSELHLLYDDGGGSFSEDRLIASALRDDILPALAFVNGADDPLGSLDTLLVAYGVEDPPNKVFLRYYRYDGSEPPLEGDILPASIARVGRLELVPRTEKYGLLAVPVDNGAGAYDASFYRYSAVGDQWAADAAIPVWQGIAVEDDYVFNPGLAACELPSGDPPAYEVGLLYRDEGDADVVLGRSQGGSWVSAASDHVACRFNEAFELVSYSDGRAGFLASDEDLHLLLYRKTIGSPGPAQAATLDAQMLTGWHGSLAVDASDVTHVASWDWGGQGLIYYEVQPGGDVERAVVDSGGLSTGECSATPAMLTLSGSLYVFYIDAAHARILYAANRDGVWEAQGEPIPTTRPAHFIWDAGYLPADDLVYIVFLSYLDLNLYCVTFTPGMTGAQTNNLAFALDYQVAVASADRDLALFYADPSDGALVFRCGPPRTAPHALETVTSDSSKNHDPYCLAYDGVNNAWAALAHSNDGRTCYLFYKPQGGPWSAPRVLATQAGPGGQVDAAGIAFDPSTGRAYVTIAEQASGSDERMVKVYEGAADTGVFDPPYLLGTYDTTALDFGSIAASPGLEGGLLVAVMNKPLAAATWDYDVFSGSSGVYGKLFTWNSPLEEPGSTFLGRALVRAANGDPALAAIEHAQASSNRGRAIVYYSW